jgi:hypothetical protein
MALATIKTAPNLGFKTAKTQACILVLGALRAKILSHHPLPPCLSFVAERLVDLDGAWL